MANIPTETVFVLVAVSTLAGCNVAVTPSASEQTELQSRIAYIKDKHGICYATVSSATYGFSEVASIATVPCEKVGL